MSNTAFVFSLFPESSFTKRSPVFFETQNPKGDAQYRLNCQAVPQPFSSGLASGTQWMYSR